MTAAVARSVTFTSDTDAITLLMDPGLSATSDRSHASTSLAIATNAGGGYDLYAKASTLTDGTHTLPRLASTDVTSGCVATGSFTTNRWRFTVAAPTPGGAGATAVRQGDLATGLYCGHTTTDTKLVDQSAPSNGDTVALTTRAKVDTSRRPPPTPRPSPIRTPSY